MKAIVFFAALLVTTEAYAQAGAICTTAWVSNQCNAATNNCERARSCREGVVATWVQRGGCTTVNFNTWGERVTRDCQECNRQYCRN